jgi:hypothetical protein
MIYDEILYDFYIRKKYLKNCLEYFNALKQILCFFYVSVYVGFSSLKNIALN